MMDFSVSLLQSHILICRFVAQETFLTITMLKTVVLFNSFVETMVFPQFSLMNRKNNIYFKCNLVVTDYYKCQFNASLLIKTINIFQNKIFCFLNSCKDLIGSVKL